MPVYYFETYDGYETVQSGAVELKDDFAAHCKAVNQAVSHATRSENSAPNGTIIVTVSNEAMEDVMIVSLACQTEFLRSAGFENSVFSRAA